MSSSLNSLKKVISGNAIGVIQGNTSSLDYSSHANGKGASNLQNRRPESRCE